MTFDEERAVAAAAKRGHVPVSDPPSGMSAVRRWTCACGMAVLERQGVVYGSAVTSDCRVGEPAPDTEVRLT